MALRLVAITLLFGAMMVCGFRSTLLIWRMVDEVNRHLPKERRFSPVGWWLGKALDVYSEHERLYPGIGRRNQLRVLILSMFVLFICAALLLWTWPAA